MFLNLLQHWQRKWIQQELDPPRPEAQEPGAQETGNPLPDAPESPTPPARKE